MKKCILVIDDDLRETEMIVSTLRDDTIGIRRAASGREAMNLLMGVDKEDSERINPDVIIIRKALPDMSAYELWNVLRNYYRFGKIKYYIITDPHDKPFVAGYDDLLFSGQLPRPLDPDSAGYATLVQLKEELLSDKMAMFFPLVYPHWLKSGTMNAKAIFSSGLKVAACVAGIGTLGVVTSAMRNEPGNELSRVQTPAITRFSPREKPTPAAFVTELPEIATDAAPVPEREQTDTIPQTPVQIATASPAPVAEEISDTVRSERIYTIGVRPAHGTE